MWAMINIGFYYRVKKGHENEFESKFNEALVHLKDSKSGMVSGILYRRTDKPSEYMIYSEWDSLDSFKHFISSNAYKSTVEYGRGITDGRPKHVVFSTLA